MHILPLLSLLALAPQAIAADWYVAASGGNDSHPGNNPLFPLATIPAAIARAQAGDTVHLGTGTFVLTTTLDLPTGIVLAGAGTVT
ncbi:MAG: hypothetical protein MUC36_19860, partial [Planctomycetes bacterium]|nr:hypothetical protein [Planctomycetota bacterium]